MAKAEVSFSASENEPVKKKKKRNVGSFPCSKCPKVFSRSDHLARHYLNHQPKEVYVCEFYVATHNGSKRKCGKTFVRKDLRERHHKRHLQDPLDDHRDSDIPTSPPAIGASVESKRSLPAAEMASSDLPLQSPGNGTHTSPSSFLQTPGRGSLQAPPSGTAMPSETPESGHVAAKLAGPELVSQASSQSTVAPLTTTTNGLAHQYPTPLHAPYQYNRAQMAYNLGSYLSPQYPVGYSSVCPHNSYHSLMMGPPQLRSESSHYKQSNSSSDNHQNGHSFVQSQNDIISWLFTESPQEFKSIHSGSPPSSFSGVSEVHPSPSNRSYFQNPQGINANETLVGDKPKNYPDGTLSWQQSYKNLTADSLLNLGLSDLNFFSNNDNPLDEVFMRFQNDQFDRSSGDNSLRNLSLSGGSSCSPTTTNDSGTPKSAPDSYTRSIDKGSVTDRMHHHATKVNLEKNHHLYVNELILMRMVEALPQLSREKIDVIFEHSALYHMFSFYLYAYWEAFHPRFSILHKPSFNTATAEPLLLLSMVMIGCMYSASTLKESITPKPSPELKLCMLIAVPLRFELFQHPSFKSPVEVWILQTLNLLEWCEKNFLSREMHERAHIHHGTTVQLLRRSPFLGGNPAVKNKPNSPNDTGVSGSEDENSDAPSDNEDSATNDQCLFRKWVDSESMKRITFMTFYLDTIDYIKFRHNPQIPFFQLQLLNLPCEEDHLWDSNEVNGSFRKVVKRSRKLQTNYASGVSKLKELEKPKTSTNFLTALKRLIKPQKDSSDKQKLSMFSRNILFAGIVSLTHQMQQTELQNNFSIFSSTSETRNSYWKEFVLKALDSIEDSIHAGLTKESSDRFFSIEPGQCKYPMYHLLQIIGISDINHYDIAIFSGSPRNMSVDATTKDLNIVSQKLKSMWKANGEIKSLNDLVNTRCIIHCYWMLWSLMLAPTNSDGRCNELQTFYSWEASHDSRDLYYAVSIATLVLWCYTYSTCGVESAEFQKLDEKKYSSTQQRVFENINPFSKENGYSYLYRIRDEFSNYFRKQGLSSDYLLHASSPHKRRVHLSDVIQKYCEALPHISAKQNISSLCFIVGSKLASSQWEVVRENGKLIINCGLRSIGKRTVQCPDLFENEHFD